MPTEVRHILFNPSEVVKAVLAQRAMQKVPTPTGQILDFGIREGADPLVFAFRVMPDRGAGEPHTILAQGAELIGALLAACRERKIPLPARGSKALAPFGSRVGLVVTLGVPEP